MGHGLALLSGAAWGGIAWLVGARGLGSIVWGGVMAAPLIGLLMGLLSRPIVRLPIVARIFASLASLYAAALLFGLAVGLWDLARDVPGRDAGEVVLQAVLAVLWGLTFSGYVLLFWPLAYLDHSLVGRVAAD
jgi:hypothetical protein